MSTEVAAHCAPERPSASDLLVIERFVDVAACARLVSFHRRHGQLSPRSDNALNLPLARQSDPEVFTLAADVLRRARALIAAHYRENALPDLAIACALTAGGFRHTLHADNARPFCPRHGEDAEELVRAGCNCGELTALPNHTPWRRYSALLYLNDSHVGGDIEFGAGPGRFGTSFRKVLRPRPGLFVLFPSNEHYFHSTTAVVTGVRYSMNAWFVTDPARASAEWAGVL